MKERYASVYIDGYANLLVMSLPKHVRHIVRAKFLGASCLIEPKVKEIIKNTHGDLFVDIGANIGTHTLAAKNNFKQIFAFEPHPNNLRRLKYHTKNFPNILIYPMAISNINGTVYLYIAPHSGWHTLRKKQKADKIPVRAQKLSKMLIDENGIDLIKVDVEGAEWEVLDGAKEVMSKIKAWIIELHDSKRIKELDSMLRAFGYSTTWVDRNHVYAERISCK